jgi:hypothetical protein
MPGMKDPSDLARAFKPLNNRRFATGCLSALIVWAVIAIGLWLWLPPHGPRDELAGVRVGVLIFAAGNFTVVAISLWGLVFPYRPINPASGLPRVTRRGRIVAVGEPLRAPLSGTPCVAYRYTLSQRHRRQNGRWAMTWIHAGVGSTAWALQQGNGPTLTVRTVTQIVDDGQYLEGPAVIERSRQWVAASSFEPRAGAIGGVGMSIALLADMKDVEVSASRPYQRDWVNSQEATDEPPIEQWHEAVLPVGATATVVGHLRHGNTFVVPPEAIEPIRAAVTKEGQRALAEFPDEWLPAGDAPQRYPIGQVLGAVVLFGGLGGVLLALARYL